MGTVRRVLLHTPLTSRLARRLRGRLDVADVCVRAVEVSPAVRVPPVPAPKYVAAELDRITGCTEWSTLEDNLAWLRGTTEFGAAMAYELPPVWFVDGNFARGRFRFEMNTSRERLLVRSGDLPEYDGAAFVSSAFGNRFFGHQLLDDLTTAVLGPLFGDPYYFNRPDGVSEHVKAYRELTKLDHPMAWSGRATRCWVFRDAFLNDSKVDRIRELRQRLATAVPHHDEPARRVFIRRGDIGAQRAPRNEPELERSLADDGWLVLDPLSTPLPELLAAFAGAEIVAGPEGSQLAPVLHAIPIGATLVLLCPPQRFNLYYKEFCDRLGIRLAFHIGLARGEEWDVEIDVVRRLIDSVE